MGLGIARGVLDRLRSSNVTRGICSWGKVAPRHTQHTVYASTYSTLRVGLEPNTLNLLSSNDSHSRHKLVRNDN